MILDKIFIKVYTKSMKVKKIIGYELTCLRCGKVWESKSEHPLRCSKCKTPYWDIPKKIKEVQNESR